MIIYRFAFEEDNEQLIKLASESGMTGIISLRIDRKPDFFNLLKMRGDSKVIVAVEDNSIIGSISISLQQVYIQGKIIPVHYVGDFKVAEKFRGLNIGKNLCEELTKYALSIDADLIFLTVSEGNAKPFPFFKGRPNIPDFENIGTFYVHQFIGRKRKVIHPVYRIEKVIADDGIIDFLQGHYRNYELGSVISQDKLAGSEVFMIKNNDTIMAVMCLTDTSNIKQNVVINLSWKLKSLLTLLNIFHFPLGISKMPIVNDPVRMLYIKYIAVSNNNKHIIKFLINHARKLTYDKSYSFVSLGLHEKDPLNKCLSGLFKVTFNSLGMFLSMKNNQSLVQKVKNGIPYEDYSLV